jgi:hypothetical protein
MLLKYINVKEELIIGTIKDKRMSNIKWPEYSNPCQPAIIGQLPIAIGAVLPHFGSFAQC